MDATATLRLLSRFTGLDASTCRWLRTVTLGHQCVDSSQASASTAARATTGCDTTMSHSV